MRLFIFSLLVIANLAINVRADETALTSADLRPAIEKSLPLLLKSAVGHRENRECFSCHNQGIPILALKAAKERGFDIDESELQTQQEAIAKFLDSNRDRYLKGEGQGGRADMAGYALVTLEAAGWKGDETTSAVTEYLLLTNAEDDHWTNTSRRPPSEATPFTTTYVSLRGLTAYGTPEQKERIETRRARVLEWLTKTTPADNEERVFRLLAIKLAGASSEQISAASQELVGRQREDGGWSQLDSGEPASALESDAYATGSALVALNQAGGLAVDEPSFQRGAKNLLMTQLDDGSWHVVSRSKPFQKYFESGFPHETDQFISCAGSAWATWALLLAHGQIADPPQVSDPN
jgi:hypothetical protein